MAAEARASSEIVLAELDGSGQRVTEAIVLAEYGALAAYATSMVVLVELQPPTGCKPSGGYIYNEVDISLYCNAADLSIAPRELPRKTLGNTAMTYRAGVVEAGVRLQGDWSPEIDALLGVDARQGAKRTGQAYFDDCSMIVRYTWDEVLISEWQIVTAARDKITFSATLRPNGLGVRTVELS